MSIFVKKEIIQRRNKLECLSLVFNSSVLHKIRKMLYIGEEELYYMETDQLADSHYFKKVLDIYGNHYQIYVTGKFMDNNPTKMFHIFMLDNLDEFSKLKIQTCLKKSTLFVWGLGTSNNNLNYKLKLSLYQNTSILFNHSLDIETCEEI
jgi:hypothetical protein